MTELFRKHYSYGETIPIINTHVGVTTDLYVPNNTMPGGPYVKAIFIATAGPMKTVPLIVEPLNNESKVVHITDIPVPIPSVRTIDLSLIFDIANYRWTPSPDGPRENGLVTFDLRLQAAFSLLGTSHTLLLDQRPCSITLAQPANVQQQMPLGAQTSPSEFGSVPYAAGDRRWPNFGSNEDASRLVTTQLDTEERLRQLGDRLMARS